MSNLGTITDHHAALFGVPSPAPEILPTSAPPAGAVRVAEILQTLLTGLTLAFIFRAFLVEPFIIPTGSMAESLLGAHATRTCPACGWEYEFAPLATSTPTGVGFVRPTVIECPNCHHRLAPSATDTAPKAGDRVLVHKWPYAFPGLRPQRWEVVVFRDPANPEQHYIKRLVGLPGESVEIVDGDVFIDGRIARKPPHVQRSLWYVVFDQAHWPGAAHDADTRPRWMPVDLPPAAGGGWTGMDTRVIRYSASDGVSRRLVFNPDTAQEYLRDFSAYNRRSAGNFVGDVRILMDLTFLGGDGFLAVELLRPPYRFIARFDATGTVSLHMIACDSGEERDLAEGRPAVVTPGWPAAVELGHLDYRVYLKVDGRQIAATSDTDYQPDLNRLRAVGRGTAVAISLTASDVQLELRDLRIERDVHYTRSPQTRRAWAGHPFALAHDEYFVLGDNSPDSHDSREWTIVGPHLPADTRPGIVPESQIVGPAAFVYLPGLLSWRPGGGLAMPDLGRVRFVR